MHFFVLSIVNMMVNPPKSLNNFSDLKIRLLQNQ